MAEATSGPNPGAWSVSKPAWVLSVIMHAALLIVLGLTLEIVPHGGPVVEPGREVGVVLKRVNPQGETYFESPGPDMPAEATASPAPTSAAAMVGEQPPIDVTSALPPGSETIGAGPNTPGQISGAGGFTTGPRAQTVPSGGKARTSVYGLESEGSKFVYVFDRSASMGGSTGYANSPLRASKAEMLASIDGLEPTHQFQIIFYNEFPDVFHPDPAHPNRLVLGTPANKKLARAFVDGIIAEGGTEHEQPLLLALAMRPDVIYFLTDAEEIGLNRAQLDRIHRANQGAAIYAIEFGAGPAHGRENFLVELARENGGGYAYVDVTQSR